MINFYEEIENILKEYNKSINDIIWIGTKNYKVNKEKFLEDSKHLKYDNGYGLSIINENLIIAGINWHLVRWEYDGSEGFTFVSLLGEPEEEQEYTRKFIIPDTYIRDFRWTKRGDK
ncbi:MAG: hypothetical protein VZR33_02425 [Methanosphaera sp.]|nr:hypothetical protein [Methanosphaera sp.]